MAEVTILQLLMVGLAGLVSFALGRALGMSSALRAFPPPAAAPPSPAAAAAAAAPAERADERTGSSPEQPGPEHPPENPDRRFLWYRYDYLEAAAAEGTWPQTQDVPLEVLESD